jgi:hypothetical protein
MSLHYLMSTAWPNCESQFDRTLYLLRAIAGYLTEDLVLHRRMRPAKVDIPEHQDPPIATPVKQTNFSKKESMRQ